MFSKKKLLIVSALGVLFFLISLFPEKLGICNVANTVCTRIFDETAETILIFIPLFLLSLLTYKMRDEVYRAWSRFAMVWVPLSMFLILIAPEYSADFLYPIEKGSVAFVTSLLFVIISLLVIIWKYAVTRKGSGTR